MTKDSILAMLINAHDCVSGEDMSRALGVSRAAVNAAVQTLRREGCDIRSSTKTGYTLLSSPDALRRGELLARLGAERMERVVCLESVGSTNDYLKKLAQEGAAAGTAVIANAQTAGRGRLGRSFLSPENDGIYLSVLLRPDCAPEAAPQLTAWAAVAVCRAVEHNAGIRPGIKWVNDLLLNGRKIAGILTEMSVESESGHIQHVIVGVGLNVRERRFSGELAGVASSLYMETGREFSRCDLACDMLLELDRVRGDFPDKKAEYLDEYRSACVTAGRELTYSVRGETLRCTGEGIDGDFGLTVRYPDGSVGTLHSGEVSIRAPGGYA